MPSIFELFIMAVIVLGMGIAIRRNGQSNPEGTGKLARQVGDLQMKVNKIETEMKGMASSRDIADLRTELHRYQAVADETHDTVVYIRNFLMEKGLGGR